jgi:hypothetical protein
MAVQPIRQAITQCDHSSVTASSLPTMRATADDIASGIGAQIVPIGRLQDFGSTRPDLTETSQPAREPAAAVGSTPRD